MPKNRVKFKELLENIEEDRRTRTDTGNRSNQSRSKTGTDTSHASKTSSGKETTVTGSSSTRRYTSNTLEKIRDVEDRLVEDGRLDEKEVEKNREERQETFQRLQELKQQVG